MPLLCVFECSLFGSGIEVSLDAVGSLKVTKNSLRYFIALVPVLFHQLAMITGALRWGPLNKSEASDDISNTRLSWP
jgi:hypothetical protein